MCSSSRPPRPRRSCRPARAAGATLTQPPTQVVVTFDQPMNLAQLALQRTRSPRRTTSRPSTSRAPTGRNTSLRLESYDAATNTATFDLLDALPNGDYQLHLSGAAGLTDLGGNPLVGNDPSGDYVVPFTVDAPPRGDGGNPLEWSDQEPNDYISDPQDLGVLFPNELAAGVTISRDFSQDPAQAPQDTADVYQFQVLLDRVYAFTLSGDQLPPGVTLTLTVTTPSGQIVGLSSRGLSDARSASSSPGPICSSSTAGTRRRRPTSPTRSPWRSITQDDNAPPLVSGPAPAVAIQLDSVAPPTSPTPPPPVTPPVDRRRRCGPAGHHAAGRTPPVTRRRSTRRRWS